MVSPFVRACIRTTLLFSVIIYAIIPTPAAAASFDVNSPDDTNDGVCDASHCSLREAIHAANQSPGPDTISFAGLDATNGSVTIHLQSLLPPISDDATTLDATTITGYIGQPALRVVKDANVLAAGFDIQSNNNMVIGFSMAGFGVFDGEPNPDPADLGGGAIVVSGSGNHIEGCTLGWGAWPNSVGVRLIGASNEVIDNVISGNVVGIYLEAPDQVVQGNKVGTDASGNFANGNTIGIFDAPSSGGSHTIGGSGVGEGNLISANTAYGIGINSAASAVQGNSIGTNAAGTAALGNADGMHIGGPYNYIGGPNPGEGNLISGNIYRAIRTSGDNTDTLVLGNIIGADISGTYAIPNEGGIVAFGTGLTIGGPDPAFGNLFFGNYGEAIRFNYESGATAVLNNTFTQNDEGIRLNLGSGEGGFTFSRNSIYDNDGLGIYIQQWQNVVPSVAPPVLTGGSATTIVGTTCANCFVEAFLAAPDPSGAGEGRNFLGDAYADADGLFEVPVSGLVFCQTITATSTNQLGNTSQFADNIQYRCFRIGPIFLIPIWSLIIIVFGAIGFIIRRRNPARPIWLIPGGLAFGAILGGGLIFGAGLHPGVEIGLEPEQTQYTSGTSLCESYLDPDGFTPSNGASMELSPDLGLAWTPTGDLPAGDIRWVVTLEETIAGVFEVRTEDTALPLAAFGLTPKPGRTYIWEVQGEASLDNGVTWQPFCQSGDAHLFTIARGEVEPEEGAEEEPEACTPTLTATMNLTCRSGPDALYAEEGYLLKGESAPIEGQNEDGTWWLIPNPDWQGTCWVWDGGGETTCTDGLPVVPAPPLPTPTPTPEPACSRDLDRSACNAAGGVFTTGDEPHCECP